MPAAAYLRVSRSRCSLSRAACSATAIAELRFCSRKSVATRQSTGAAPSRIELIER